ncbi:hypothetical protein DENSPDRAFT_839025 [Dentipellis sp. KUC8613]|nr:hypothetical protein DENSPDRAFT_839025 [Dentipellis sp. KUC8613]
MPSTDKVEQGAGSNPHTSPDSEGQTSVTAEFTKKDELKDAEGRVLHHFSNVDLFAHGKKMRPLIFKHGGNVLRSFLPKIDLPAFLDPACVDCPANDLPLTWFGFAFNFTKAETYARRHSLIAPLKEDFGEGLEIPGRIDTGITLSNVQQDFYKRFRSIKIEIWPIWDEQGEPEHMFALFSNRMLDPVTGMQKYEDDTERFMVEFDYESRDYAGWYLDRRLEL